MLIFRLSQTSNNTYDTYDSCVVTAPDEDAARSIFPGRGDDSVRVNIENDCWEEWTWTEDIHQTKDWMIVDMTHSAWALPSQITVELIGVALPDAVAGVVCASFNAG